MMNPIGMFLVRFDFERKVRKRKEKGKQKKRKNEEESYLNGPMNISYRRRESAPYSETTSSGLTTFPLLLLILWARAIKRILGLSFSTKESPYFLTYKRGKNYEFAWLREKNWKQKMGRKIHAYLFLRYSFLVLLTQCISRVCRYKIPTLVFKCHVFYLPISKLGFKLEKWKIN